MREIFRRLKPIIELDSIDLGGMPGFYSNIYQHAPAS